MLRKSARCYAEEVEASVTEAEDAKISYLEFDYNSFGTSGVQNHPNVEEHQAIAQTLEIKIAEFMGWE